MEAKKIAAMAEAYNMRVAPHNCGRSLSTAASLQLSACIANFTTLEIYPYFPGAAGLRAAPRRPARGAHQGRLARRAYRARPRRDAGQGAHRPALSCGRAARRDLRPAVAVKTTSHGTLLLDADAELSSAVPPAAALGHPEGMATPGETERARRRSRSARGVRSRPRSARALGVRLAPPTGPTTDLWLPRALSMR